MPPRTSFLRKPIENWSKEEVLKGLILAQSRGLPVGTDIEGALQEHLQVLTSARTHPDEPFLVTTGNSVAQELLLVLRKFKSNETAHVSLSNSACLELSRSKGGRTVYCTKEVDAWLDTPATETRTIWLPLDGCEKIELVEGILPRYTVRPRHLPTVYDPLEEDGRSRKFGEPIDAEGPITVKVPIKSLGPPRYIDVPVDEMMNQRLLGLETDRRGFQLFAWAFLECVKQGWISWDGSFIESCTPPRVERMAIPEPGGKVRIVTKSPAALVTYGQPFAHVLKEALLCDPTLQSGLESGYQSWEWAKRMNLYKKRPSDQDVFFAGDFKNSTDFIQHEHGRILCHQVMRQLGFTSEYVHGFIDLLLSPREMEGRVTTRGSLMGEPGTKIVLTLIAKGLDVAARQSVFKTAGELAAHTFQSAGDDQLAFGPADQMKRMLSLAEKFSVQISVEKAGIYKLGAPFCEQAVRRIESSEPMTAEGLMLDFPKMRLLSVERKILQGDSDKETNPAIGKAFQLQRMLGWCDEKFRHVILSQFVLRMWKFLPKDFRIFLPTQWGGMGVDLFLKQIWHDIPDEYRSWIAIRERGTTIDSIIADKVLQSFNELTLLVRGRPVQTLDDFSENVQLMMPMRVSRTKVEQILNVRPGLNLASLTRQAKHAGYLTVAEAARLLSEMNRQVLELPAKGLVRGFKSRSWLEREKDQLKAAAFLQCDMEPLDCPVKPRDLEITSTFVKKDTVFTYGTAPYQCKVIVAFDNPLPSDRYFFRMKNYKFLHSDLDPSAE